MKAEQLLAKLNSLGDLTGFDVVLTACYENNGSIESVTIDDQTKTCSECGREYTRHRLIINTDICTG